MKSTTANQQTACSSTPDLTFIVPVYNAAKNHGALLKRCINSIKTQSNPSFRAIVIDDGSNDNSWEIVNKECSHDSRFLCLSQDNQGVARTRNRAISLTETDYLTFVDQDDWVEKDYAKTITDAIRKNDSDIAIGGYKRIDPQGNEVSRVDVTDQSPWWKWVIVTPWARVYRTSFLKKNEIRFLPTNMGEDLYFNVAAYGKAKRITFVNYTGYTWFYNPESISNTLHKGFSHDCDLIGLLDSLSSIGSQTITGHECKYFSHWMVRQAIWYLLYSGKTAKPEEFDDMANQVDAWLHDNHYYRQFHFWSKEISCEALFNRVAVSSFLLIQRFHLTPVFSRIYCKG